MSSFTLHLLRHGAPDVPGLLSGHEDRAPTEAGIAACMDRAAGLQFDHIVASDLSRSRIPAERIAQVHAASLIIDSRWRELDFGAWDGLPTAIIDPQALRRFWADPDADPPPGGERWSSLMARVRAALMDLTPRPTLVLTHGGAMRAALAALCGLDHRLGWAFDLPYAALLSLRVWPGDDIAAQVIGLRT